MPTTTVTDGVPFSSAVSFIQTVDNPSSPMTRLQDAFDESQKSLDFMNKKLEDASKAYNSFSSELSSIFTDATSTKNYVEDLVGSIDTNLAGYNIPVLPAARSAAYVKTTDHHQEGSLFQKKMDSLLRRLHKKLNLGDFEATVAEFTSQIKSIEDDYYALYDQNRANVQTMQSMKTDFVSLQSTLTKKVLPTLGKVLQTSTAKKSSAAATAVEMGVEGAGEDVPVRARSAVRREPPVRA